MFFMTFHQATIVVIWRQSVILGSRQSNVGARIVACMFVAQ
jgi:hypothetical protein